jgi:hypothetical protein
MRNDQRDVCNRLFNQLIARGMAYEIKLDKTQPLITVRRIMLKYTFGGQDLAIGWKVDTVAKNQIIPITLLYIGSTLDVFDLFSSEEELLFKEMQDISSHKQVSLARQLIADIGYDILQSIKRHCIKEDGNYE